MFKVPSKKIFLFLLVFVLTAGWFFSGWPRIWHNPPIPPSPQKASAVATNMLLLWDGGAAPSGWSIVTTYDNKFPRGESAANFGITGGSSTHTPTSTSVVNNASSVGGITSGSVAASAYTHTHTSLSVSIGSASNFPAYRSLKLIKFDAGIPVSIPTGAIAIFDATAPSGWTRQIAQDGNMVLVDSTVATGGSDTHTHTLTWSSLSAATQTDVGNTNNQAATTDHTHTAPATSTTASDTVLPPYIQVVIAKADSATASLPNGMIAMFDGDPGSAWTIASNSGGAFYQQFIQGASLYNGTSTGAIAHTHSSATSGVSGAASAKTKGSSTAGTAVSGPTHTHTLSATFNSADNTPSYFNVVYAKKNTNIAPNAPSQNLPANSATGVSVTPTFTMTATDADPDNISYKVTIYSNSICTTVVQTNDQAVSSTGWTGSNATCVASPTACYASGTQGSFLTQTALSASTQYWWKASAKDPDGNGGFTDSSTCNTFTTGAAQSLTFSISDFTIGFGNLATANARFANGAATGDTTEVEAHTLTASTNAASGYIITVLGATLTHTNSAFTIAAIGGTNTVSAPGTEQFGLRATVTSGTGTVTAPYAAAGFAYAATASAASQVASGAGDGASTIYSMRYIGNIAAPTEAGSYSATLTYVATATF